MDGASSSTSTSAECNEAARAHQAPDELCERLFRGEFHSGVGFDNDRPGLLCWTFELRMNSLNQVGWHERLAQKAIAEPTIALRCCAGHQEHT